MAKYATNASSAMLLPSLVQVSESISGSVVALAMFCKKNAIFLIIFVGKIFVYQNIYGFTPVKKRIIIFEQKLGLYFSKLLKSLMLWIAT